MMRHNVVKSLYRFQLSSPDGKTWTEAIPAESEEAARLRLYGRARLYSFTVGPCLGTVRIEDLTPSEAKTLLKEETQP